MTEAHRSPSDPHAARLASLEQRGAALFAALGEIKPEDPDANSKRVAIRDSLQTLDSAFCAEVDRAQRAAGNMSALVALVKPIMSRDENMTIREALRLLNAERREEAEALLDALHEDGEDYITLAPDDLN